MLGIRSSTEPRIRLRAVAAFLGPGGLAALLVVAPAADGSSQPHTVGGSRVGEAQGSGAAGVQSTVARGAVLERTADGFSVAIPAGWTEKPDADAAATIVQRNQPDILAMIFVQKEPAPALVTDVLARAAVKLKTDPSRTLVSSAFDVVADRPALVAIFDDKTARYKLTLFPRDKDAKSQVYYGIMAAAPRALFAKSQETFDRIVAGFEILPGSRVPAGPKAETAAAAADRESAAAPARPVGVSGGDPDRARVIDRILAPRAK